LPKVEEKWLLGQLLNLDAIAARKRVAFWDGNDDGLAKEKFVLNKVLQVGPNAAGKTNIDLLIQESVKLFHRMALVK